MEPIIQRLLPPQRSKPRRHRQITHVVIHFMSNVVQKPDNPFDVDEVIKIFEDYPLSSHYIIDRDGRVIQLVDENRRAFHAGKGDLDDYPNYANNLNEYSIGIELLAIGTREEMAQFINSQQYDRLDPSLIGFTDAQYDSLNELLAEIYERWPSIVRNRRHVIGHDEYAPGRKTDPGRLFDWNRVYIE